VESGSLSWQLFLIIMTTASISRHHIDIVVKSQRFGGQLYVSDTAEEVGDGRGVEVAVKQISSHSNVTYALARRTHLKHSSKCTIDALAHTSLYHRRHR